MSSIESAERHQPDDLSLVLLRFCVHHTLVFKPTKAWKFELECWIAPARCGETVVWDLRRASVKRRRALFRPVLRFRKVCIMKLSHLGVHSSARKTRGWRRDEFRKCFAIREKVGGRDRDRTGDPLLAKQVLSQLSYTPTVEPALILKYFRAHRNPFLRIMVKWNEPLD